MRPFPRILFRGLAFSLLSICLLVQPLLAQSIVDQWRYRLATPGEGWQTTDFDDSSWDQGYGGFGSPGTPGARISTRWQTDDIWLRKEFQLEQMPGSLALLIHHDEDATVFLNGQQIAQLSGYTSQYEVVKLEPDAAAAAVVGKNLLAIHCQQSTGGQFIDAHLVDADNVPELPAPQFPDEPFKTPLTTSWGEQVTAENAWQEYPRPMMERAQWINLNGHWDYAITSDQQQDAPQQWAGKILVPFSLESALSGVQKRLDPDQALWYHREFELESTTDVRWQLNFEAVDYRCKVWVNGQEVGQHTGGNIPFSFDIADSAKEGKNQILIRVEDDTEGYQLRGKQVLWPGGIWYTQVSGIWQTVWLEPVPQTHLKDFTVRTNHADGTIQFTPELANGSDAKVTVAIRDGQQVVAQQESTGSSTITLTVADARLWSPDSPFLYDMNIQVQTETGVDEVISYVAIRSVGKVQDEQGHWRLTLNGQPIFHWGPLDQGWWPDGLLTPPSDEAMCFDIDYLKSAGFNMIRKHIKVEPRRYYSYCDRVGMLVWQDQVSAGNGPAWTRLAPNPSDADWPDEHHQQFMAELEAMIDHLENYPSIVVWVPFNEAWGQHRTVEVGEWTVKRDPSRTVNIASGGNFWPVGDIVDQHAYPHPEFPFQPERFGDYVKVVGEFGGHGYPVTDHLWDASRGNWGYGGLPKDEDEYQQRYVESIRRLKDLKDRGIAAGVYTQTTDVEVEINGLITYDRRVIKIPAETLKKIHQEAGLLK